MRRFLFVLMLMLVFGIGGVSAFPQISFVNPTPVNESDVNANSFVINFSIIESSLKKARFVWEGTSRNIYDESLILGMNFNGVSSIGDSSGKVVDISRYGKNNGTMKGDSLIISSGRYGKGLSLDGNGDYLLTGSNELKQANDFTIMLWFKTDDTSFSKHLFWQGLNESFANGYGNEPDLSPEMHLSLGDFIEGEGVGGVDKQLNNTLVFFLGRNDTYGRSINPELGSLNISVPFSDTSSFNHVVISVKNMGSSPSASMYLNGKLVGSDTGSLIETNRSRWSSNLIIGKSFSEQRFFDGVIDELFIFNRSLSEGEIRQIYFSNLRKYGLDKWSLTVRQKNSNGEILSDGDYGYYGCVTNSSGSENCTSLRNVNINSNGGNNQSNEESGTLYLIGTTSLNNGFNSNLKKNDKIDFLFEDGNRYILTVKEVNDDDVEFHLEGYGGFSIFETSNRKLGLTSIQNYQLQIDVFDINGASTNVTIKSINEVIPNAPMQNGTSIIQDNINSSNNQGGSSTGIGSNSPDISGSSGDGSKEFSSSDRKVRNFRIIMFVVLLFLIAGFAFIIIMILVNKGKDNTEVSERLKKIHHSGVYPVYQGSYMKG